MLQTSKATCLFVGPDLYSVARQAASVVGIPEARIFVLQGRVKGKKSLASFINDVQQRRLPVVPTRPAKRDTLAYLVFSSGTTGLPKGMFQSTCSVYFGSPLQPCAAVMVTHGNIAFAHMQNIICIQASGGAPPVSTLLVSSISDLICQKDLTMVGLAFLPFYHTYGLHCLCLRGWWSPSTFVVLPRWDADLALKLIPK